LRTCRVRYSALIVMAAVCLFAGAVPASGADFKLTPSITLSESYTDNVYESRLHKKSEFITDIMPGFSMIYTAPFWNWDLDYRLDYRIYDLHTKSNELNNYVTAIGHVRVVDNTVFVDVRDTYSRTSLDVIRGVTTDSSVNQTDANDLSISPYITLSPGGRMALKAGYIYRNLYYSDPAAIGRQEHSGFARLSHQLTPKTNIFANGIYTHSITSNGVNYDVITPSAGFDYEYATQAFAACEGGYSYVRLKKGSYSSPYWNARLSYPYNKYVATLGTGVSYDADPRLSISERRNISARLDRTLERGGIDVYGNYSEYKNVQTNKDYSRGYEVGGNGIYSFTQRTTGHLDLELDKLEGTGVGYESGYRCRFGTGLVYQMPYDLSVGMNYNYTANRGGLANEGDINRFSLFVTKRFPPINLSYR